MPILAVSRVHATVRAGSDHAYFWFLLFRMTWMQSGVSLLVIRFGCRTFVISTSVEEYIARSVLPCLRVNRPKETFSFACSGCWLTYTITKQTYLGRLHLLCFFLVVYRAHFISCRILRCPCPDLVGASRMRCCGLMSLWRVCIVTRIACIARLAFPSATPPGYRDLLCGKGSGLLHGTICTTLSATLPARCHLRGRRVDGILLGLQLRRPRAYVLLHAGRRAIYTMGC